MISQYRVLIGNDDGSMIGALLKSKLGKVYSRIGTELFSKLRDQLKSQDYRNEVFIFVDAFRFIDKDNL